MGENITSKEEYLANIQNYFHEIEMAILGYSFVAREKNIFSDIIGKFNREITDIIQKTKDEVDSVAKENDIDIDKLVRSRHPRF